MSPFLTSLVIVALKVSVLLGASLLITARLRSRSAALRHHVLAATVVCALLLPAGSFSKIGWTVPAPLDRGMVLASSLLMNPGTGMPSHEVPVTAAGRNETIAAQLERLVLGAWLVGSCALILLLAWTLVHFRSIVQRGVEIPVGDWAGTPARAVSSPHCSVPCTVGLWRPVIVLPADWATWSPAHLRAVLIHEGAHASRRDPFMHMLVEVLCAMHWWNPLVWLVASRLRLEAEHAADDVVLKGGFRAHTYAAQLLEWAAPDAPFLRRHVSPTATFALPARIRALMAKGADRSIPAWGTRLVALFAIGSLAFTFAAARVESHDDVDLAPLTDLTPAIRDQWREGDDQFEIIVQGRVTPARSLEDVRVGGASRLILRQMSANGRTRVLEFEGVGARTLARWTVDGASRPISDARTWSQPLLELASDMLENVTERRALNQERAELPHPVVVGSSADPQPNARRRRILEACEALSLSRRTLVADPEGRRSHGEQLAAERRALELERQELRLRRSLD